MSITVLEHIERRPKRFYRKLKKYYRRELNWSKTFRRWEDKKFGHRIKHLKALKMYPGEVNTIANIIRCLDKLYPQEGSISYGNKTVVETAIIIQQHYGKSIRHFMKLKLKIGTEAYISSHTEEEATEELIERGFMNREDIDLDSKLPFIHKTGDKNLVWPAQYDLNTTYEVFPLIGVSGYTGVRPPRNFRG